MRLAAPMTVVMVAAMAPLPGCYDARPVYPVRCSHERPGCPEGYECNGSLCLPRSAGMDGQGATDGLLDQGPATDRSRCGDGKKNSDEECDGEDFGGKTCTSYGHKDGKLVCKACAVDSSGCSTCSDGKRSGEEECDKNDLGQKSCKSLCYASGTLSCDSECTLDTTGCTPPGWLTIKVGTFTMGGHANDPCHHPERERQHKVTLKHDFEITATEVTQEQYEGLMGSNPSEYKSAKNPVGKVTWHEAVAYCNALSQQNGYTPCYVKTGSSYDAAPAYQGENIYICPGYRLPTDAEWEYAYRAGTATAYYSGDFSFCFGKNPVLSKIGWYRDNSGAQLKWRPHTVATKEANAFCLFDMAGNVWEYCHDWYQYDLGAKAVIDPAGPPQSQADGPYKVERGGSYWHHAMDARASQRETVSLNYSNNTVGFRCVRSVN